MKIDKVYFICRDPGNDRYWSQMGALSVMGVPSDRIECFKGIDARDNKFNTFEKLADAMVDDGFEKWGIHRETEEYHKGPRSLAVQWSHLRCLRQIVERGENAIVLEDDCYLVKAFRQIESALSRISDLKCLYLDWEFLIVGHGRIWEDTRFRQRIQRADHPELYTGYIPVTHRAKLYTPQGAKEHLDVWEDKPMHDGESLPWLRNIDNNVSGFYFAMPYWALLWCVELKTETYSP